MINVKFSIFNKSKVIMDLLFYGGSSGYNIKPYNYNEFILESDSKINISNTKVSYTINRILEISYMNINDKLISELKELCSEIELDLVEVGKAMNTCKLDGEY